MNAYNKKYEKMIVRVEKWFPDNDTTEHLFEFEINKQHQATIKSFLRQMFEHPNTKFSAKLKKIDNSGMK